MLALIATFAVGPHSGIIVIDRLAIGVTQNGRWESMDSIYSDKWPKQTIPTTTVTQLCSGEGYVLGERLSVKPMTGTIAFVGDEGGPGDRGWMLADSAKRGDEVIWFGPKPTPTKLTFASNTSPIYLQAVKDYLKAKGIRNAKPILQNTVLADLDANGTNEALIFASSRQSDDMFGTFTLSGEAKYPNDYSLVLVRYLSGKTVKTTELYYTDGRKSSLSGHCTFAGLWDLDGKPGLEILYRWAGYEAWSATVARFSKGKVATLAEAGDGV